MATNPILTKPDIPAIPEAGFPCFLDCGGG
jgi:hypothetical protein